MGGVLSRSGLRRGVVVGAVAALAALAIGGAQAQAADPPYSVDDAVLDASLDCPEFAHPDREPVLLVHGTFTAGHEQFDWNYLQVLPGLGYDVCVVTYPDRGLGDQQVSAEYVAHAIITMHEATGRQVDLVGHSQGAAMPRWAVRFWPSARAALDDYVGIAGPHHGTDATPAGAVDGARMPEAFFQFSGDSRFLQILNAGDETPGEVDWTNLYTRFDELVQSVEPEPTAALDHGRDNPRVANVLLQDVCPGRVVDHLTIGTTDRLAFDLVVDALSHDGPADPDRLDVGPDCSAPDQVVEDPQQLAAFVDVVEQGFERGLPNFHLATEEPATRDYARASDEDGAPAPSEDAASPTPEEVSASPAPAPGDEDVATAGAAADVGTPATGGGAGIAGAALVLLALGAARPTGRPR